MSSATVRMIRHAIDYPPNHERIISTTENIPNIPAPVASPLIILCTSEGGLAKTCNIATILSVFCCIATILSSRSKSVFSFMPLYGMGMGFALLFITFVMFFPKKQRPLQTAAWMVTVTFFLAILLCAVLLLQIVLSLNFSTISKCLSH